MTKYPPMPRKINDPLDDDPDFQKFIFSGDNREWLTKQEAMKKLEWINQSNKYGRPYVRVNDRGYREWLIEGTEWKIISYVNIYSRSWSRRVAKLVINDVQYGTREARNYLK